ncbi:YbaN family protein [Desulfolithobacter dissulfuricans]|nr:YbaN family protein [Desulfolithobacter dissulfuricans]
MALSQKHLPGGQKDYQATVSDHRFCFTGPGVLGVVLPLLPTVPFVLLAAACFAKSSDRAHAWLCTNRIFGPMIRQWHISRSIPKKSKHLALGAIICSGAISTILLTSTCFKLLVIGMLSIPVFIVLRLPTSNNQVAQEESSPSSNQP